MDPLLAVESATFRSVIRFIYIITIRLPPAGVHSVPFPVGRSGFCMPTTVAESEAHSLAALSGIVFAALSTPAGSASVNVNDCFAEVLMIRHGLTLAQGLLDLESTLAAPDARCLEDALVFAVTRILELPPYSVDSARRGAAFGALAGHAWGNESHLKPLLQHMISTTSLSEHCLHTDDSTCSIRST
ncbi:hypothetical protein An16g04990 [Aspergillus niger]|uniref:Uncharacterized protein n=2 Tax=Aspergillus niger TaxID=5061 RepID=A2R7W5_ASPNC|nr:hypothetical protein An16g04990 [Aspergillus niger]CAK97353.1 hypothetical protein An16g04990 [Aspergillus niger]